MFDRDDDDLKLREDDVRADLMAGFELFDAGKLTADNAYDFELPAKKPTDNTTERKADGGADGADQGERGRQTVKPDSSPATGDDKDSRDRQRDAHGRFAKGEGESDPAAKPAGAETQAKPGDKPPAADAQAKPPESAAQQTQAASPEPAPDGLGAKASQLWATATPEVRDYIASTESALAKLAGPVSEAMTVAKEIGIPWNQYVGNLIKTEVGLRKNPMDTMLWIAERQGIDLDALADYAIERRAGRNPSQPGQANIPPELQHVVAPLVEQVAQLTSRLSQREQAEATARQDAETREREHYKREVATFAAANPNWNDVKSEAFALMSVVARQKPNATFTEIIKDAYDRAVFANPAVRAKIQAEADAKAREAQRARGSRALETLTSHRGGPTSQARPVANGSDNLRDEISANFAAFDAR